jgi:hypothetical protein
VHAAPFASGGVHRPPAQYEDEQSARRVHAAPTGFLPQLPPAQVPDVHMASLVQRWPSGAPHVSPVHTPAAHSTSREHGHPLACSPHEPKAR